MALMLFQFCLESLEQSKRVCRSASKSGDNAVMEQAPDLARRCLEHDVSQCHLTITTQRHSPAAPNRHYCCSVENLTHNVRIDLCSLKLVPESWGP